MSIVNQLEQRGFWDRHTRAKAVLGTCAVVGAMSGMVGGAITGLYYLDRLLPNEKVVAPRPTVDFDSQVIYQSERRQIKVGNVVFRDVCVGSDMLETVDATTQSTKRGLLGIGQAKAGLNQALIGVRYRNYPDCEDGVLNQQDSIIPIEQMAAVAQR